MLGVLILVVSKILINLVKLIKTNTEIGEILHQNSNCSNFYAVMLQQIFRAPFCTDEKYYLSYAHAVRMYGINI